MKIELITVQVLVFYIEIASSFLLKDFHLVRNTDNKGDVIRLRLKKSIYAGCNEYDAKPLKMNKENYTCRCPLDKPMLWYKTGEWKCFNEATVRNSEGCQLVVLNKTETGPLTITRNGTTSKCDLVTTKFSYFGCNGSWVTPKLNKGIWRISLEFLSKSQELVLKISRPFLADVKGKVVKLIFSDNCALSTSPRNNCLLLKVPGETQCRDNNNEKMATDFPLKMDSQPTVKNVCTEHWNEKLLSVVISAVSIVVLLIIVIIILVVILQRRRMQKGLTKVLQEIDVEDNQSTDSSRHYVDMSGSHTQGIREQSTQTESFMFVFQGSEPDYATITKKSTKVKSDYYNINNGPGPVFHDYATLRWLGPSEPKDKVHYYNLVAKIGPEMENKTNSPEESKPNTSPVNGPEMENNTNSPEENKPNTSPVNGCCPNDEQELMQQVRKLSGNLGSAPELPVTNI